MLQQLRISNYAIIDELEIDFSTGLTIITGETGAGKSILLGALGLIMGERADTKTLYDPEQKCVIEGQFGVADYDLEAFFDAEELDYDAELIIRREISPSGKSRAFINDTPVTIKVLQRLTGVLVDLHQQFDTLDIHEMSFQLRLLDALAQNGPILGEYRDDYRNYTTKLRRLEEIRQRSAAAGRDMEFIQFQLQELQAADLRPGEDAELEEELNRLTNAEDIQRISAGGFQQLAGTDPSQIDQLQALIRDLNQVSNADSRVERLEERLLSLSEELQDIAGELESIAEETEYDGERILEIQQRLDVIYRLQKKHHVTELSDLLSIQSDLEAQLSDIEDLGDRIRQLEKEIATLESRLRERGQQLSERRAAVAPDFTRQVEQTLADLAMPHTQIIAEMEPLDDPGPEGLDALEFLFSANRGSRPQPIRHVASGGELSRLTLVMKSLVAGAMALPTLIFDEIDSGVSGDVALKMGLILRDLSQEHQVVVITHSPQVAARGQVHYFIYKVDDGSRTTTRIRRLTEEERVRAIATMLSQSPPSPSALENAKELIGAAG